MKIMKEKYIKTKCRARALTIWAGLAGLLVGGNVLMKKFDVEKYLWCLKAPTYIGILATAGHYTLKEGKELWEYEQRISRR